MAHAKNEIRASGRWPSFDELDVVVIAHNRQVFGHTHALAPGRVARAYRLGVAADERRGWRFRKLQQGLHGGRAGLWRVVGDALALRARGHTGLVRRLPIAALAAVRVDGYERVFGMINQCHATMPQIRKRSTRVPTPTRSRAPRMSGAELCTNAYSCSLAVVITSAQAGTRGQEGPMAYAIPIPTHNPDHRA